MPKSKASSSSPAPRSTGGFYKKNGNRLSFAPTKVHFPNGSVIEVTKHSVYRYPILGWSYYETAEAAYAAEGLEMPPPLTHESIAAKIASRRAMSPEERETERAQRDAEKIAHLQERNPERAAKLQARLEERQAHLAQRSAMTAMSPQERRAAREAERTTRLAARKH